MEDDTEISWPALLSWSVDVGALAPLGFQRGFFRTEISQSGDEMLLDAAHAMNMMNVRQHCPPPPPPPPRAPCPPAPRAPCVLSRLHIPSGAQWRNNARTCIFAPSA